MASSLVAPGPTTGCVGSAATNAPAAAHHSATLIIRRQYAGIKIIGEADTTLSSAIQSVNSTPKLAKNADAPPCPFRWRFAPGSRRGPAPVKCHPLDDTSEKA